MQHKMVAAWVLWRRDDAAEGGRRENVCDLFTLCFAVQLGLAQKK
jgi:hypothetical protein